MAKETVRNELPEAIIPKADRRHQGDNVIMGQRGSWLIIALDTSANLGASASGKTDIVASTRGNAEIHTPTGTIKVGVNAYKTK